MIDYDKVINADFSRDKVAELFTVPVKFFLENDPEIQYAFDWGDGTTTTTTDHVSLKRIASEAHTTS